MGAQGRRGDREVIEHYLEGDAATFRTLDAWIRTEIRNGFPVLSVEADDLTQSVHAKLVEVLRGERFRYQSSLKTYVVRLARYTCVDRVRARYRTQLFRADDASPPRSGNPLRAGPYRRLFRAERRTLLLQIVLLSPEMCRVLWRLAYLEQLSYEEIGRRLCLPSGTIKSRMWSCRQKALALLERLGSTRSEPERSP